MVKYRGRLEIIVDILKASRDGAKKTKIMYLANLSYKLLERYLRETVELGFIDLGNTGYEVTEKGQNFLEKYNDFTGKYSKIHAEFQKMQFEKESLEKLCEPERSNGKSISQKRCHV